MWKDIKGTEGTYQVSSEGEVRSLDRYIDVTSEKKGSYKTFKRGAELRPQANSKGYLRVGINGKLHFVHRLVASAFLENEDESLVVNHKDGNPKNNTLDNLEWCTRSENGLHAFRTGLNVSKKGEDTSSSKLSDEQVIWILKNYEKGCKTFGRKPLSRMFNVSHQTIKNIVDRKKWKHIQL